MMEGAGRPPTYITVPQTFSGTRVMDHRLSPTVFNLEVVVDVDRDGKSQEASIAGGGIGFRKLKTWLELVLPEVVMVSADSEIYDVIEGEFDNQIMVTPGEPDDFVLSMVLLAKMQAIVKGQLKIDSMTLTSSDTNGIRRYMHYDMTETLPGIEYFPQEAVHKDPWWLRDTIETQEFLRSEVGEDFIAEFLLNDPLKAIEREEQDTEADIIIIDSWKKEQ